MEVVRIRIDFIPYAWLTDIKSLYPYLAELILKITEDVEECLTMEVRYTCNNICLERTPRKNLHSSYAK